MDFKHPAAARTMSEAFSSGLAGTSNIPPSALGCTTRANMVPSGMSIKHLSYSSVNTFDRCPKQFQLGRVMNAWETPAVYFALGTAVHESTEAIDRGESADFVDIYYREISEGLLREPDINKWLCGGSDGPLAAAELALETGPRCIENWKGFTSEVFQVTDIELDVTARLPGMWIPTKGFIDRVGTHDDHGDMIIDIKAGKNKPKDKGKQLKNYASLLAASTGQVITKGAYYMAQEGKMSKVYDLSDSTPETLGSENKAKLREMNEADKYGYEAKVNFTCRFCTQQLNCFAYSGDTARTKYYDSSHPEFDKMREVPF